VIATADGEPVKSMKTAFRSLLKACGFVYPSPDDRHTLTSLRHTYATFSLTRKSAFRPRQEVLAKQMGTSTRMIQAHQSRQKTKVNISQNRHAISLGRH
jgi:hypothetical protein